MSLPVSTEALDDVHRVVGRDALIRKVWGGDNSAVFQVFRRDHVAAYLKIATGLSEERARLQWLDGRLPVPRVLSYDDRDAAEWLLLEPVPGLELANLKHTESPGRIVRLLAAALRLIHAMPTDRCPFGEAAPGAVLTHGDPCLPNFLYIDDELSGVLDVGAFGLGDVRSDLAIAVWSVQYNLGPGHARAFLDAYDIDLEANELELVTDADGDESLRRAGVTGSG